MKYTILPVAIMMWITSAFAWYTAYCIALENISAGAIFGLWALVISFITFGMTLAIFDKIELVSEEEFNDEGYGIKLSGDVICQ